jgi:acyl-CoA synthetase (AMP-forming)/AMP-acid ligase II
MSGYFGAEATREAFRGGWFHSGELGVWHPDGYIQLRDRAKAAWPARPSCSLPEHAAVLVARRRSRGPPPFSSPAAVLVARRRSRRPAAVLVAPPPLAAPRGAGGR